MTISGDPDQDSRPSPQHAYFGFHVAREAVQDSGETLYLYAPLAHRLGLFTIKTELEDLSFKYEHPEAYKQIQQKIQDTEKDRQAIYENFAKPIEKRMKELGFKFEMKARVKSVYSIWNKMQTKHIPFEEVYDLYAVRIIFQCNNEADEKKECWNIYSIITDIYKLHPERTRDWVSRPKANGYKPFTSRLWDLTETG